MLYMRFTSRLWPMIPLLTTLAVDYFLFWLAGDRCVAVLVGTVQPADHFDYHGVPVLIWQGFLWVGLTCLLYSILTRLLLQPFGRYGAPTKWLVPILLLFVFGMSFRLIMDPLFLAVALPPDLWNVCASLVKRWIPCLWRIYFDSPRNWELCFHCFTISHAAFVTILLALVGFWDNRIKKPSRESVPSCVRTSIV